ncbi:peroxiredoxin family protein [Jeongeupia naejangsanensis]|uniref:TlpA family protein disulfide reductase n=1 Tax=Jeongeupia naejangsanensis TaxID=613195 RepID=A0ABS2BLG2_9NEIS|nr:TlpA disulfide reductase family protein [Jeongeupia naejangsanensis]MBM3116454.1 TlpA family protein disulfide reductase [Jeongeupia naejangsanensis]
MKTRYLGAIAVLLALLAVGFFISGKKSAPDVSFTTLEGKEHSLSYLKGQVLLVNFWATSCSGCMQEMPELIKLQQKYGDKGYKTLAIAMNYDVPEYIENYRQRTALPFIVSHDKDGSLAKAFGDVALTPTSFLLDKNGKIVKQYVGIPNMEELNSLILKSLND